MYLDKYRTVQYKTGVFIFPNYPIRLFVSPVCPRRSTTSNLGAVLFAVFGKLSIAWGKQIYVMQILRLAKITPNKMNWIRHIKITAIYLNESINSFNSSNKND